MRAWSSVPSDRATGRGPSLTAFASAIDHHQHERDRSGYSDKDNDSDAMRLINTVHEIGSAPPRAKSEKHCCPSLLRHSGNGLSARATTVCTDG